MRFRAWSVVAALAALAAAGACAQGALENPQDGATESGISAITGWHCTSRNIELRIDGQSQGAPGMGTQRADTAPVCGRTDTGFAYLFNYSLLKGGTHRVDAYADGRLFASATFTVGYLGSEVVTGKASSHYVPDFPAKGLGTHLAWSQAKQNYVVTGVEPPLAPTLVGTYDLRHVSMFSASGKLVSSLEPGLTLSGTFVYRPDHTCSFSIDVTYQGTPLGSESVSGTYADHGAYVVANGEVDVIIERGDTLTFHTMGVAGDEILSVAMSATRTGPATPAAHARAAHAPQPSAGGVGEALARVLTRVAAEAR